MQTLESAETIVLNGLRRQSPPNSFSGKLKARLRRNGWKHTLNYAIFVVVLERLGVRLTNEYVLDDRSDRSEVCGTNGFVSETLTKMDQLSELDCEFLRNYGECDGFADRFSRGRICHLQRSIDGALACACWYGPIELTSVKDGDRPGIIDHCFTVPEYRGRGLYPWALHEIVSAQGEGDAPLFFPIFIECSRFNHSSSAGIAKAGFTLTKTTLTIGSRALFTWRA
jgi:hypothetical protein